MAMTIAATGIVSGEGCTSPNQSTVVQDVQTALAIGCPILGAVQNGGFKLNAVQTKALQTLALVCPPNPPPTSTAVVVADIVQAYTLLAPLVPSAVK